MKLPEKGFLCRACLLALSRTGMHGKGLDHANGEGRAADPTAREAERRRPEPAESGVELLVIRVDRASADLFGFVRQHGARRPESRPRPSRRSCTRTSR